MDRSRLYYGQDDGCPVLCNCVIFAMVALFIMYLPLGDPYTIECSESYEMDNGPICHISSAYILLVKIVQTFFGVLECILRAVYMKILEIYEYCASRVTKCGTCQRDEKKLQKDRKSKFFKNCFKSKPDDSDEEIKRDAENYKKNKKSSRKESADDKAKSKPSKCECFKYMPYDNEEDKKVEAVRIDKNKKTSQRSSAEDRPSSKSSKEKCPFFRKCFKSKPQDDNADVETDKKNEKLSQKDSTDDKQRSKTPKKECKCDEIGKNYELPDYNQSDDKVMTEPAVDDKATAQSLEKSSFFRNCLKSNEEDSEDVIKNEFLPSYGDEKFEKYDTPYNELAEKEDPTIDKRTNVNDVDSKSSERCRYSESCNIPRPEDVNLDNNNNIVENKEADKVDKKKSSFFKLKSKKSHYSCPKCLEHGKVCPDKCENSKK